MSARDGGEMLDVIDADAHVMEPSDLWQRYVEGSFRERAPKRVAADGLEWGQMVVDGEPMYRHYPDALVRRFHELTVANYAEFVEQGFSAASTVAALDRQGIQSAYLYPSLGLGVTAIDGQDPDLSNAIVRGYNDWLRDFVSVDPDRLKGVALISLNAGSDAEKEVRRAVYELGMRQVMLRPNPVNGKPIGHPDYRSFWETCAELDVPVALHEGCHTRLPAAGADRFETHFAMHACCHPMEQMMAFVSLVESGTFERFPRLRVGFMEAGCGWVPYLLWRLDSLEYRHFSFQVPEVKRPPSEYFATNCFVTVEGCEPYLARVLEEIGAERCMFASDFPHPDHEFGEEIDDLTGSELDEGTLRSVLSESARRFYCPDRPEVHAR